MSNSYDHAVKVVRDAAGDIIVTGTTDDGITGRDMLTIKYSGADGSVLWLKRYNGPANRAFANFPLALAADGSNNVVVVGYSDTTNWYGAYYTAKHAAADGALLWEVHFSGPVYFEHFGGSVAVDGSGNVVVTGSSATIKYLADGTAVWTNSGGVALAIEIGANVIVTGSSFNGTNYDYYTAKYAAANGALLWEQRYKGLSNAYDSASSLALGPNGMVAVTGVSSDDYATVVYWENLPPVSLALVPAGVRIRFTGVPGRSYNIERAPAVTGPWTTINTQTSPASGLLEYIDTNSPPGSAFYRTAQP